MRLKIQREWIAVLAVTCIARMATLQYSSIDHDESTYLIIAQQWLQGHLPWTDFLDIKPIGIYALFAAAIGLFGEHIVVARLLAILFISATAWLVIRILRMAQLSNWQARLGAFLYIVSTSIHQWSWASNTELFFVFFTALGYWMWLRFPHRLVYGLVGISFGLGFCIKYHIAFDLAALGLVHLLVVKNKNILQRLADLVCIGIGFIAPIGVWVAGYLLLDKGDVLREVLLEIPGRYSNKTSFGEVLSFIGEFYLVFLPISLLFIWTLIRSFKTIVRGNADRSSWMSVIWPCMVWIAIIMTGKQYFHYYIQQILPLIIISCLSLPQLKSRWSRYAEKRAWVGGLAGALLLLSAPVHQYLILYSRQDKARAAAEIMQQNLKDDDVIFANTDHIVYFLCKKAPPTRFVHSSLFHKPDLQRSFGMNLEAELASIFAQSPRYCLVKKEKDAFTKKWLKPYQLIATFGEKVELWGI